MRSSSGSGRRGWRRGRAHDWRVDFELDIGFPKVCMLDGSCGYWKVLKASLW